jgi:hypothetical protein
VDLTGNKIPIENNSTPAALAVFAALMVDVGDVDRPSVRIIPIFLTFCLFAETRKYKSGWRRIIFYRIWDRCFCVSTLGSGSRHFHKRGARFFFRKKSDFKTI